MSSSRSRRASARIAASVSGLGIAIAFTPAGSTAGTAAMRFAADLPARLLDQLQLLGEAAEIAITVGIDDDQVLDPHPELARQVDPGLDRHHFAGREHVLGALRDAGLLVDLQPYAVPEAVAEALAVPSGGDQLAGDPVDVLGLGAGPNRGKRRRLRFVHGLVDHTGGLAWLASCEGPGAVRAVAVELGAHVEDDQLAQADLALAGLGVGQRAIGAGRDDGREGRLGTELAHTRLGGARHVELAAAGEPPLEGPAPDLVGKLGSGRDRRQLPLVLDPAQRLDR